MIGFQVQTRSDMPRVISKAKEGSVRSLSHAAAVIRITAKRSIRKRKGPAPEGSPPHTHTKRLPNAILYHVDKTRQMAVIGPSVRIVGIAGAEHEHGVAWRKKSLGRRPFMFPALEKTVPRLPRYWVGFVR